MSETTKRVHIPAATFIETVWNTFNGGGSVEDAAKAMDMQVGSVQTRMSQYRTKGISMPKFPRTRLNWDELKAFAAQFEADPETTDDE